MKRLILTCIGLLSTAIYLFADMIILKNGDTIKCDNIDVASEWLYYENGGTIRKVCMSDVFGFKVGDGEMQRPAENIIQVPAESDKASAVSGEVKDKSVSTVKPDANNESIIASYNARVETHPKKKPTNKKTDHGYIFWGIGKNSILSDENVEISLEHVIPSWDTFSKSTWFSRWKIFIKNKTSDIIYVDLANVFQVDFEGEAKSYYDSSSFSTMSSSDKGVSLGVGAVANVLGIGGAIGTLANGIGISGGSNKGTSVTKTMDRIVSIPPHARVHLPGTYKVLDKEVREDYNSLNCYVERSKLPELSLTKWTLLNFDEQDAPIRQTIYLNYSTIADFSDYKLVPVYLYSRCIYGTPLGGSFNNEGEKYFKHLPERFVWSGLILMKD